MSDTIATDILIGAPIERVWTALVDFKRYAEWNPYLVRIEGEAAPGTTITVHSRPVPGGEAMVQPILVVGIDPPHAMRWAGGLPDRAQFRGDHWFELDTANSGATRFRHYEHFTGTLADQILAAHGEMIRANFIRFNEALKAHCESQP